MNYTLHKMYDPDKARDSGDAVFYVNHDGVTEKLEGIEVEAYLSKLKKGDTVRLTSMGTWSMVLLELWEQSRVTLLTASWHKTGVKKNLKPEALVEAFAALDASLFREYRPRRDTHVLRELVAASDTLMVYRKAAYQKLLDISRSMGLSDADEKPDFIVESLDLLAADVAEVEPPIMRQIAKLAKTVPECKMFNKICGISDKSWGTAAAVIAYLQDMKRFDSVAKLWAYAGYNVIDGHAPSAKKGDPYTWNSKLRTALWKWADSMLKSRNPIWRPVYDTYRAEIIAKHPEITEGHAGRRARRLVIKDVLKELWIRTR